MKDQKVLNSIPGQIACVRLALDPMHYKNQGILEFLTLLESFHAYLERCMITVTKHAQKAKKEEENNPPPVRKKRKKSKWGKRKKYLKNIYDV